MGPRLGAKTENRGAAGNGAGNGVMALAPLRLAVFDVLPPPKEQDVPTVETRRTLSDFAEMDEEDEQEGEEEWMSYDDKTEVLFAKPSLVELLRCQEALAVEKVHLLDTDYLFKVSEVDLVGSLEAEFRVELLEINREAISAQEPTDVEIVYTREQAWAYGDEQRRVKGFEFRVIVPFKGDPHLLRFRPQEYDFNPPRARIAGQELHLLFRDTKLDTNRVRRELEDTLARIERYADRGNNAIKDYNNRVKSVIPRAINERKAKLLENLQAAEAIGIPIRRRKTPDTYPVPAVRRSPKVELPKVAPGPYKPEPTLASEDYEFILKVIQNMALVIERSPHSFVRLKEEHLRDHFLLHLNGHFEGAATGETFNCEGKTDILIRHENRNLFIAECKFWRGDKGFTETIDQLFGYTSWRDTKTAVLIFNRNQNLTKVLEKIPGLVQAHPNFKRELPRPGETQFRYVLHQKGDRNRELILTVLAFDVPTAEAAPASDGALTIESPTGGEAAG